MFRIIFALAYAYATITFLQYVDISLTYKLAAMGFLWAAYGYIAGTLDTYSYLTKKLTSRLVNHLAGK